MKTKSLFNSRLFLYLSGISFLCLLSSPTTAQELEQLISSKMQVMDENDWQVIDCNTYRFDDEILYDNPNLIRLYENNTYRFNFRFTYFDDGDDLITPSNYLGKFHSIQIPPSVGENYRVTAISPAGDSISIYAIATGEPGKKDTFHIQLLDDEAKLLADVIYPFEIQSRDPDATTTAYLPMKMEFNPIYITFEDANNPNNRIERQLLPFSQDTIHIDAKDAYNMLVEIEQRVDIGAKSYVLVADHEKDYGYQVRYRWEGNGLRYKPGSKNGLKSYLTAVPGKKTNNRYTLDLSSVMAQNLKKAGLDKRGKRTQQEFTFREPNTKLQKVYQNNYIRLHPNVTRSRTDQKQLEYIIEKNKPQFQYNWQKANQKLIQNYQLYQPNKAELQKASTKAKVQKEATATTKTKLKKKNETYQLNNAKVEQKKKENTKVQNKDYVIMAQPRYQVVTTPGTTKPASPYYTLAIELSRETDAMSVKTYFITFRLID